MNQLVLRFSLSLPLLFCLSGCDLSSVSLPSPGHQDFAAPLAGDYWLFRTSAWAAKISPESYGEDTPIIPHHVVECGTDGRYILAKRQRLKRRSPDNPDDTFMEPDPGAFDFWVLDSQALEAYGPLTEDDFKKKRNELGVSTELELQTIYEFKE